MNNQKVMLSEISLNDFLEMLKTQSDDSSVKGNERNTVYGLAGIAELFGCSIATANRIKKSGIIKPAISQIGRKIVVDAKLALLLAAQKRGGRK